MVVRSFRNYPRSRHAVDTIVNADGTLTNRSTPTWQPASGKYQVNKNNQVSAFWTYNRKFQPHRVRRAGAAEPDQHAAPGIAQEPDQRQLDVGIRAEHLPRGVVHLLPCVASTFSDEFLDQPGDQQRLSTFNVTTGIYLDGPEPTGQRLRDAYRHQTNIGVTRYIDGFSAPAIS